MHLKKVIILLLLCFCTTAKAQSVSKLQQKADDAFKKMAYVEAIETYQDILTKDKSLTVEQSNNIQLKLAEAYYLVKDFENAERIFSLVLKESPLLKGDELKAYLKYAQVLTSNGKRQEAAVQWKKYNDLQEQDRRAENFLKLYPNLDALTRNSSSYMLEYIGINTSSADFSPTYYADGLVFVSGRPKNSAIKRVFSWDNSSFLDLYFLEDIKLISPKSEAASVSTSQSGNQDSNKKSVRSKLGSDYYTPPTANDAQTIAHQGSDFINGSKNYEETASVETRSFSKNLNSKYHEGPCAFFDKNTKIIFTRNSLSGPGIFGNKKDEINRLHLYIAEKKEKDWGNIKEFPYNSSEYSTGHPTVSKDDKVLYFVSDMPGGFGGTDIYLSKYKNGAWSPPQNLGGSVNTQGNEMFPFVDDSGNLYFSSDVHPGLGDLDIFYIDIDQSTFMPNGKIRNLGAPLNSNRDDFGIITDGDRSSGYFSSNRKRGGSDDDIYRFTRNGTKYGCRDLIVSFKNQATGEAIAATSFQYTNIEKPAISESATTNNNGSIKLCLPADNEYYFYLNSDKFLPVKKFYSNKDASDFEPSILEILLEPIQAVIPENKDKSSENEPELKRVLIQKRDNTNLKIFKGVISGGENNEPVGGVKIRFINKCTGQVQEKYSKKDGSYEFDRDPECDYELVAIKDDFATSFELIEKSYDKKLFGKKVKVKSNASLTGSLFDTKLYKVGDVVKLDNIYYNSDEYKIKGLIALELDKLVGVLERYPNMIIEIYSHTDTRGNAQDNMLLSQRRALEVENYLVKKGISRSRIKAIGKGETQPVNNCSDGVQCTEAEHQRNRRTEFKILQIEKI